MLGIGALIALCGAWALWHLYGWHPALSVGGTVVDRSSGRPVSNAHVVVTILQTRGSWYWPLERTGCSRGSSVVQTDSNGRFRYVVAMNDAFAKPYPDSWVMLLEAFHPDYTMPPSSGRGLRSRTDPGDDAVLGLVPKSGSSVDRMRELSGIDSEGCVAHGSGEGPAELFRAIYREQWSLACDPLRVDAPMSFAMLMQASGALEGSLNALATRLKIGSVLTTGDSVREEYVGRKLLGGYPWAPSAPDHGRPLSTTEATAFCEFYAPPADRVLTMEIDRDS